MTIFINIHSKQQRVNAMNLLEQRNALFAISGLRAKYPQFFQVDPTTSPPTPSTTFWGDWMKFQMTNHRKGKIAQELGGMIVHHVTHPIDTIGMAWDGVFWGVGMITGTVQAILEDDTEDAERLLQ